MSQPVPPPGKPFAENAAPQPYPAAPPAAPARDNVGLGLVVALAAAIVTAVVYGAVAGGIERQIGWAAVGVGFAVGYVSGRFGGGNPVLPVASAALSLGAVYLGQLIAFAIIIGKELDTSATDIFLGHFGELSAVWKEELGPLTFLFFGLAAFAAFSGAKKAAQ